MMIVFRSQAQRTHFELHSVSATESESLGSFTFTWTSGFLPDQNHKYDVKWSKSSFSNNFFSILERRVIRYRDFLSLILFFVRRLNIFISIFLVEIPTLYLAINCRLWISKITVELKSRIAFMYRLQPRLSIVINRVNSLGITSSR